MTDAIPGTSIDDVALGLLTTLVALTVFAAAARKPPLRQVGMFVGWIFRRLVGEPLAGWYEEIFEQRARPIIERIVDRKLDDKLAPVTRRIADVERELRPNGGHSLRDRIDATADHVGTPPPPD